MEGDVTVRIEHSTVNYKDGLAVTGKAPIIRKFPLIPGVDFAGTVTQSAHPEFKTGDKVILNGWGVGESPSWRLCRNWPAFPATGWCRCPGGSPPADAMAIGTAGYTAMLCVMALEQGVQPSGGEVLVTGAAGGVGSIAIAILARLGYRVVASTGRHERGSLSQEPRRCRSHRSQRVRRRR